MRKFFSAIFFLVIFLTFSTKIIHAGCAINIAYLTEKDLRTCLSSGADSIVFVTDANNTFEPVLNALEIIKTNYPGTLVELRFYNDARPWTTEEIYAIVAAAQSVDIGRPILLRPYNEWLDYNYVWEKTVLQNYNARIQVFYDGMEQFRQAIEQSGSNLVLGDMLDYHRFTTEQYQQFLDSFEKIAGQSYYSYISGMDGFVGLNGYWTADPNTGYVNFGMLGNISLNDILSRMPAGTTWRFSEFGYIYPGGMPVFDNPQIMENAVLSMVAWFAANPQYASTFAGFNIFTADPNNVSSDLGAEFIANLAKNNPTLLAILQEFFDANNPKPFDLAAYLEWMKKLVEEGKLVECKNTAGEVIGYAPTIEQCATQFALPQGFGVTGINSLTCPVTNQGSLRPNAYSYTCESPVGVGVSAPVDSVATTFYVTTHEEFDVETFSPVCSDPVYPDYSWDAIIAENYSQMEISWTGFGQSTEDKDLPTSKYLTDYLEGTSLYNGENHLLTETWKDAGVFRKLVPDWYADQLKCDMVKKAKSDDRYNYSVKLKWSTEEITFLSQSLNMFGDILTSTNIISQIITAVTRTITIFGTVIYSNLDAICNSPLSLIVNPCEKELKKFECPPTDPTKRFWYNLNNPIDTHLWPAVPMFTREDTPGTVTLTAQHPNGVLSGITEGFVDNPPNKVTHTLSIPNLTRNQEIAKATVNMMLPAGLQDSTLLSEIKNIIIAAPKTNTNINNTSLPSLSLLAQAPPANQNTCPPGLELYQSPNGDGTYTQSFKETLINDCYYRDTTVNVQYFCDGNQTGGCSQFFNVITHNDPNDPNNHPLNFACQPSRCNGNLTTTVSWSGGVMGGSQDYCGNPTAQNSSCSCTTSTTNGITTTTCQTLPTTPTPPPCGYTGSEVGQVSIDGDLDPKDPDKLDNVRNENDGVKGNLQQNLTNPTAVPLNPMRAQAYSDKLTECRACRAKIPPENCHGECFITFNYSTEISSTLLLPYLEKIRNYTANDDQSGFLNILRPGYLSGFEEADSKTNVSYSLVSSSNSDTKVTPDTGYIELPFLQGLHDAQACISQRLLIPGNFAANVICPSANVTPSLLYQP